MQFHHHKTAPLTNICSVTTTVPIRPPSSSPTVCIAQAVHSRSRPVTRLWWLSHLNIDWAQRLLPAIIVRLARGMCSLSITHVWLHRAVSHWLGTGIEAVVLASRGRILISETILPWISKPIYIWRHMAHQLICGVHNAHSLSLFFWAIWQEFNQRADSAGNLISLISTHSISCDASWNVFLQTVCHVTQY